MSSSNTKQTRLRLVPIWMEEDNSSKLGEGPKPELPDWAQAIACISPCSVLVALATHPNDTSASQEVINGLINNICYQQQQSKDNIGMLQTTMEGQQALIQDLTQWLTEAKGAVDLD